jgi:hypothetical protein
LTASHAPQKYVRIEIIENGLGFLHLATQASLPHSQGKGLTGLAHRAALAGIALNMQNNGCLISFEINLTGSAALPS